MGVEELRKALGETWKKDKRSGIGRWVHCTQPVAAYCHGLDYWALEYTPRDQWEFNFTGGEWVPFEVGPVTHRPLDEIKRLAEAYLEKHGSFPSPP